VERERRARFKGRVAGVFELPGDLVFDLPRVTLIGNIEVTVENHRGLIHYSPDRVVIGFGQGQIVIGGQGLAIGSITPEEITLTGRVAFVNLEG